MSDAILVLGLVAILAGGEAFENWLARKYPPKDEPWEQQIFRLQRENTAANAEIERLKAGHLELSRQAEEWEQQTFELRRQIDALTAALRAVWSELNEGRADEAKAEARKAINLADADRARGGS